MRTIVEKHELSALEIYGMNDSELKDLGVTLARDRRLILSCIGRDLHPLPFRHSRLQGFPSTQLILTFIVIVIIIIIIFSFIIIIFIIFIIITTII